MVQKGFANVMVIISVVIIAVIVGGGIYWRQNMEFKNGDAIQQEIIGDYQWRDASLQSQYSDVVWNKITTSELVGFFPSVSLTEKRTEYSKSCASRDTGSYLRIEGGLCGIGYWLEDPSGSKIDSREKLIARFAPVESEAEAVSFIAITQGGLKTDVNGILDGRTAVIDDGFLVQLVNVNAYGCGTHQLTGIIFKVLKNGEFQWVAGEKQKSPKPGESVLCID